MSEVYQKNKEEVVQMLESTSQGLTTTEVATKQKKYGWNELVETEKKNLFLVFLEQFKDFLVIILIGAAIISGILGDVESSLVIFIVITMNAILGTVQHAKAEKSLEGLKQLSAPQAKVLRDGEVTILTAKEVVPGDVVLLEAGDYVCADGRILENASLKCNESALTGESLAVEKEDSVIENEVPLGDRKNMVFSGSFVTYGRGGFIVTKTGMETEVGKIATLLKNTEEHKTPLQESLDQFGKRLSIMILAICGLLFLLNVWKGEAIIQSFMFAVALAVAAIPEALSSIVTIVLAFGTQKMAKEHAIIRKLQAVEGLGSVSIICSDKTGTLTQNKMTVTDVYVGEKSQRATEVTGENELVKKLLLYSILCNDASNKDGVEVGDPTEVALVNLYDKVYKNTMLVSEVRNQLERIAEIPFDSERKLMSTVHAIGNELIMVTKGAVDVLLDRICSIEEERGVRPVTSADKERILQINQAYSKEGLRVLAFAYKKVQTKEISIEEETEFTFLGLLSMMDPPREESKLAVEECWKAGIRPIMITGDHKVTAAAIARQIGILREGYRAVEGAELEQLTDDELQEYVDRIAVYARVSPEHKIRIVQAWQRKGNIVAMTGDGVNDAPALKQADVGVAMGITGTEVAKDAAAMILTDDNFATIVKAVENGRNVYQNIKKSIRFLLSGNTAGILAVVYTALLGLELPFAPVHLLFINLLTDSLPAIALGLDPHSQEVMLQKPRSKKESILTKDFVRGIIVEGIVIAITTMLGYYVGLNHGGTKVASTMAFATLCLGRLVHGYNSKSSKAILGTREMNNNKFLHGAFIIGFVLLNAVLLIPVLRPVFQVATLSWTLILCIYFLAMSNLLIIQGIKWVEGKVHLSRERKKEHSDNKTEVSKC